MKTRALLIVLTLMITGCAATRGTPDERRSAIREMRSDVLAQLYAEKASARAEISAAPGYGVFSTASVNLLLASFGGGYGVVRDNQSGKETFMNMGEVGLGLGAGVKDFRVVFVFHDQQTLNDFVQYGWSFGGEADAAIKAGDKGGAVSAAGIVDGVTVYQITETGLALQATLKGTRYWKSKELN